MDTRRKWIKHAWFRAAITGAMLLALLGITQIMGWLPLMATEDSTPDAIKARGVLRVGFTNEPPYAFVDDKLMITGAFTRALSTS